MLGKLIKTPVGILAATATIVTGVTAAGSSVLNNLGDWNPFAAEASETQISCFDKEQNLDDGKKQGVSVCFENSLDNVKVEFYKINNNGVRSTGLSDEEKFKDFISLQTFEDDIETQDSKLQELKEKGSDMVSDITKSVKGVNEIAGEEKFEEESERLKTYILAKTSLHGLEDNVWSGDLSKGAMSSIESLKIFTSKLID